MPTTAMGEAVLSREIVAVMAIDVEDLNRENARIMDQEEIVRCPRNDLELPRFLPTAIETGRNLEIGVVPAAMTTEIAIAVAPDPDQTTSEENHRVSTLQDHVLVETE